MSEPVATVPAMESSKLKKSKTGTVTKKPKTKPAHPKTADMVDSAIKNLKERGGSSLLAIKKYIASNYKVDADKMSHFIKKYLKTAVGDGKLVQTKGKGASGSFKLANKDKKTAVPSDKPRAPAAAAGKSKTQRKPAAAVKTKSAVPEKVKKAVKKPKSATKKASGAASKKSKSPSKAKVTGKASASKNRPKAPKPKTAASLKSKSSKKAAAKKK